LDYYPVGGGHQYQTHKKILTGAVLQNKYYKTCVSEMSAEIESSYELDDIDEDEEDLRSPLILDQSQNLNTSKCSTFSKFLLPSPRSIVPTPDTV
jgi:hypothetical protein